MLRCLCDASLEGHMIRHQHCWPTIANMGKQYLLQDLIKQMIVSDKQKRFFLNICYYELIICNSGIQ